MAKTGRAPLVLTAIFIAVFFAQSLLFAPPCYSENIESISSRIKTPEELAAWLSHNIEYEFAFGGKTANTIQEILSSRSGNCEDFANLASEILKRMGIESKVVILRSKRFTLSHAVCVWKDSDGAYSFTSNAELHRTKETNMERAVMKFFPEYDIMTNYSDIRLAWRR